MNLAEVTELSNRMLDEVERAVVGKRDALRLVLLGLLADGHVLIEDYPGLAKTLVARSFAQVAALEFARIQFTPDLMPADVTGSSVYDQRTAEFEFRPGPVFTNLLLADEINRAPPKTQAALLEAMQERQVTIEGRTRPLDPPFVVLATQNPIEYEGTYPLPEAQLDRFLLRIGIGYPSRADELDVLERRRERRTDEIELRSVVDGRTLRAMQQALEEVHVAESVGFYIVDLVRATRESRSVQVGASPRGKPRDSQAGARPRGARRPRLRHPRRRQGGCGAGARPPVVAAARAVGTAHSARGCRPRTARDGADTAGRRRSPALMSRAASPKVAAYSHTRRPGPDRRAGHGPARAGGDRSAVPRRPRRRPRRLRAIRAPGGGRVDRDRLIEGEELTVELRLATARTLEQAELWLEAPPALAARRRAQSGRPPDRGRRPGDGAACGCAPTAGADTRSATSTSAPAICSASSSTPGRCGARFRCASFPARRPCASSFARRRHSSTQATSARGTRAREPSSPTCARSYSATASGGSTGGRAPAEGSCGSTSSTRSATRTSSSSWTASPRRVTRRRGRSISRCAQPPRSPRSTPAGATGSGSSPSAACCAGSSPGRASTSTTGSSTRCSTPRSRSATRGVRSTSSRRRTLPPQALVIGLTALLDERSAGALLDLRARGFDVAVVEISPLPYVSAGPQPGRAAGVQALEAAPRGAAQRVPRGRHRGRGVAGGRAARRLARGGDGIQAARQARARLTLGRGGAYSPSPGWPRTRPRSPAGSAGCSRRSAQPQRSTLAVALALRSAGRSSPAGWSSSAASTPVSSSSAAARSTGGRRCTAPRFLARRRACLRRPGALDRRDARASCSGASPCSPSLAVVAVALGALVLAVGRASRRRRSRSARRRRRRGDRRRSARSG